MVRVMAILDAIVVGAGFSGLCAGVQLREAGFRDFLILEKADRVGGTWRENTYPGAACDVPSHLYSYSFAPNPNWTRTFATQPEILAYLEDVADRFGVLPHVRTNTAIASAEWDDAAQLWTLTSRTGEIFTAHVLV